MLSLADGTQVAASVSSGPTGDIASVLAAASDRVVEKCGYVFDDATGMYYDAGLGLYYHQVCHFPYSIIPMLPPPYSVFIYLPSPIPQDSQLYYDAESGTYYSYDTESRQYQFHSRVKLPPKKKEKEEDRDDVIDLCSSSSSEEGMFTSISLDN